MTDPVLNTLTKEAERIKGRLNEIEEIMSYTLSDLVELKMKGQKLIAQHKETGDEAILKEIQDLATKLSHINTMLKRQSANGYFVDEEVRLKLDLERIENELYCRRKSRKMKETK